MCIKDLCIRCSFEQRAQTEASFDRRAATLLRSPAEAIKNASFGLAVLAVASLAAIAQTATVAVKPPAGSSNVATGAARPSVNTTSSPSQPPIMPRRAALFYDSVWGVDTLSVRVAESGELIRFSWRVLDPAKAKTLSDKKFDPALIAPASHVKLVIPSLEKIGQLRQSSPPEVGKAYWMAFSNPGRVVKKGDRVDISIGPFRIEGITVE